MSVIRVHRGGEITIPAEVRDEAYLYPRDELYFTLDCDGRLTLGDYEDDETRAHPPHDWKYWAMRAVATPSRPDGEPLVGPFFTLEEFFADLDREDPEPS